MSGTYQAAHALLIRDQKGPRVVGRCPHFTFEHEEYALWLAAAYGEPKPGAATAEAQFALHGPDTTLVYCGKVLPLNADDPPTEPILGFHIIIVTHDVYKHDFRGNPFPLLNSVATPWNLRGGLPELVLNLPAHSRRDVTQLQQTLKAGDGPLLLGMTQAVLDGAKVALVRDAPDPQLIPTIWELLPDRVRCDVWPCTWALASTIPFDVLIVPVPAAPGYLHEEQVRNYPEGRYELALQTAIEAGDQAEIDRLMARKSSKDVLRMAIGMVAFALLVAAIMKYL